MLVAVCEPDMKCSWCVCVCVCCDVCDLCVVCGVCVICVCGVCVPVSCVCARVLCGMCVCRGQDVGLAMSSAYSVGWAMPRASMDLHTVPQKAAATVPVLWQTINGELLLGRERASTFDCIGLDLYGYIQILWYTFS